MKKLLNRVQIILSTFLTWVTFLSFIPSLLFAVYHLFWDFDFQRVIASVAVLWVCVHLNQSL